MMATHKQSTTREPVRLYTAVMAGWSVLLAGSAFADLFPVKVYGLLLLTTGAVQVGVGEYTRGQVTPSNEVVAQQKGNDPVLSGPRGEAGWGIPEGSVVSVDPAL